MAGQKFGEPVVEVHNVLCRHRFQKRKELEGFQQNAVNLRTPCVSHWVVLPIPNLPVSQDDFIVACDDIVGGDHMIAASL